FGRVIVFGGTVGLGHLGDAYQAANTVPNIIFDLVAGGALASLVVPLLAGPASRDDHKAVAETVSALLTWVVGVLTVLALALAVAVLSLCLLIPMRRLHLRLRPATRLDGTAARALRPLALAGVVTLGAQQLTTALYLALAWRGPTGSVVVLTIAQTIYLLP